ncbi:MAG: chloride channel protein [Chitinophagaceae bacterium]|nr:MAG: chloride channel protein [Chitinophagaceae bacterium]
MNLTGSFRRFFKKKFDSYPNNKLKRSLLNALPFWTGAFIAGCVAVLYAKLFSLAEAGTMYFFHKAGWSLFVITPLSFLLAWWLVIRFAPFAKGSGIPQVIAAIDLTTPGHSYKISRLLSIRVVIVKVCSSVLMVFGGGVTGREGPTIQIAATIFKKINDLLPAWYPKISRRNMIVTGAAAGLAAAFNTPLGGIVFAIEELTKTHFSFFKSALLTGVIIAGLTALTLLGPYLYLGYPSLDGIPVWILLVIIPLAIISGLAGSGMGSFILYVFRKKNKLTRNFRKAVYVVCCGLLVAGLAFCFGEIALGSGKEIMVKALFTADKHVEWYVPLIRMVGSIITFTTGAAGGVFAPSLAAGASIGAVTAELFHLTATQTNLVILCGMTGFLSGITRSPFTSLILVLEMTNTHNIIFYIMITALLANLVAQSVSRHSFYDQLSDQYIRDIHKLEKQTNPGT